MATIFRNKFAVLTEFHEKKKSLVISDPSLVKAKKQQKADRKEANKSEKGKDKADVIASGSKPLPTAPPKNVKAKNTLAELKAEAKKQKEIMASTAFNCAEAEALGKSNGAVAAEKGAAEKGAAEKSTGEVGSTEGGAPVVAVAVTVAPEVVPQPMKEAVPIKKKTLKEYEEERQSKVVNVPKDERHHIHAITEKVTLLKKDDDTIKVINSPAPPHQPKSNKTSAPTAHKKEEKVLSLSEFVGPEEEHPHRGGFRGGFRGGNRGSFRGARGGHRGGQGYHDRNNTTPAAAASVPDVTPAAPAVTAPETSSEAQSVPSPTQE